MSERVLAVRLSRANSEISDLRERLKFAEHIADEYRRVVSGALEVLATSRFGSIAHGVNGMVARSIQKKLPKKLRGARR